MNLNQGFARVPIIADFGLQYKTGAMIDLCAFVKPSRAEAHTGQSDLLGVDRRDIAVAWSREHRTDRSGRQERGLLNQTSIPSLCGDHFGQFCQTRARVYCLLDHVLCLS
jgi:hypothetical protein